MTSNIGSKKILEASSKLFETEEGKEVIQDIMKEELRSFLRPEFLNRIDNVVIFRALSKKDLRGIVDIQLRYLEKLIASKELKLDISDSAKDALVDIGYEPAFGARPLKRAIIKNLQDPLAEQMIVGNYASGTIIKVTMDNDKFVIG